MKENETDFVMLVNPDECRTVLLCPDNGGEMLDPGSYMRFLSDKGEEYTDAYRVSQDELQFYCIDERITVTEEQNRRIAEYLSH